jgi:hypothetical protein
MLLAASRATSFVLKPIVSLVARSPLTSFRGGGIKKPPSGMLPYSSYSDQAGRDDDKMNNGDDVGDIEERNVLMGGAGLGFVASIFDQLMKGLKARAAYDSSFNNKLSAELVVGFTAQIAAEVGKRGANSLAELDFIIAK